MTIPASWECRAVIHGTVPSICEVRNPVGARRCFACGAERPADYNDRGPVQAARKQGT